MRPILSKRGVANVISAHRVLVASVLAAGLLLPGSAQSPNSTAQKSKSQRNSSGKKAGEAQPQTCRDIIDQKQLAICLERLIEGKADEAAVGQRLQTLETSVGKKLTKDDLKDYAKTSDLTP